MDKADGSTLNEDFRFGNLGDFSTKSLVDKSQYLTDLNIQQEQYNKILKQAKSNKILKNVLDNPETRSAFMDLLNSLAEEIESNK
jgi:predicted component of type VI protein secretion system